MFAAIFLFFALLSLGPEPGNQMRTQQGPPPQSTPVAQPSAFGMNVSSEGTYTKVKAGKPKFDSDN